MNVARRVTDDIVVLDLSGQMTGLDAPGEMKDQVRTALSAGHRRIVLNLAKLSFVDSSFIGELVSCCLIMSRAGGALKVACPVRRVQELFVIMHLGTIIESFDTETAAIESFLTAGH
jgi:anti-sigma B factor antagonist